MTDYTKLVEALRCCAGVHTKPTKCPDYDDSWCGGNCLDNHLIAAADAIEALQAELQRQVESLLKRIKNAELKIELYKGEADLYKDLYRSAHEAFLKELYGTNGTHAYLQSLRQSPIPCNPCPNRAEDLYNLCANHPEKPDCSENPNG